MEFPPEVDKIEQEIGRKFRYETRRHTFQIYGMCEKCRKKSSRKTVRVSRTLNVTKRHPAAHGGKFPT